MSLNYLVLLDQDGDLVAYGPFEDNKESRDEAILKVMEDCPDLADMDGESLIYEMELPTLFKLESKPRFYRMLAGHMDGLRKRFEEDEPVTDEERANGPGKRGGE